jgi:hypothetical protein
MKITDINIDQLLYTEPVRNKSYDSDEEEGGFFKKIFSKNDEPEVPFFNTRVEEFGRDELYEDIKAGYDAYMVTGATPDTMIVLSRSYLIIPGKEIFPLCDVAKFGIYNELETSRPYEQYAIDRFDEPYDPDYVSEFDNEEGFELDRFNIWLIVIDENNLRYSYVFPMEVADRKDFREKLNERLAPINAEDHSAEDVMEGRFSESEYEYNLFYLYI